MSKPFGWTARSAIFTLLALGLGTGCSSSTTPSDGDAGLVGGDGAVVSDASADAGSIPVDAGRDAGAWDPDAGALDSGPPDAGPACRYPVRRALSLPSDSVTDTLRGDSLNSTTSCTTERGTLGPEHFYSLHVEERIGVVLRTTAATDTVIAVRAACDDPVTEVACNNDANRFEPGDATVRTVLEPGDYYVLVDVHAFGIGGDYTLTLETFEPAPNATCETAIPVSDGDVLTDQDSSSSGVSTIACASSPSLEGHILYYRATVPTAHRLTAEVRATWGAAEVRFLDGCDTRRCLGGEMPPGPEPTAYLNTGPDAEVIIAVGIPEPPFEPPGPILFDLSVRIEPLPDHAVCSSARPVTDGSVETGDTGLGDPTPLECPPVPPLRGLHYYSISVPPGQALRAIVRPVDPFFTELGVAVLSGCAGTCLASSEDPGAPVQSAIYRNDSAAPVPVIIAVGQLEFAPPGRFELTVDLVPLPTNVTCGEATPVAGGSTVIGDLGLGGADVVSCGETAENVLYYSTTIPPGQTLGIEISSADPVVAVILDGCGGSCLATSTSGRPGTFVRRTNSGTTDQPVIIAVGRRYGRGGPFTMQVSVEPAPENVTCGSAVVVSDGDSLSLQDARAGADDLSSACEPGAVGRVLYYRATVPAGETLTATATPTDSWRPVVRLLDSCTASSCLSYGVYSGRGATTASHHNSGATAQDVIIAVGSWDTSITGYFRLDVTIGPPPYTETTVASACDDVSSGPVVSGVSGDDSVSALLPLPFTVPLFGDAMTVFAVSTNGLLQVFPSWGRTSAVYSNQPIPTSSEPNSMVAALWDDLEAPLGSSVRTLELGTGDSHRFVVEWNGFRFLSDSGSTLTFQAKLFESGVVELHYCGLTATDPNRASGASATVGLEDATGTIGAQHSHNTAGSIGTADAIRFTPAP